MHSICFRSLLLTLLIFYGSPDSLAQSLADEGDVEDSSETVKQEFLSIRFGIYSKPLKEAEENKWGVKFKLRATVGIYKYKSLDEFLDTDNDHLQSIGLRPKLEFEKATSVENLTFIPNIELAWNHLFDGNKDLISGSATAALRYIKRGEKQDLVATLGAKYGTRYDEDGLNLDDYVDLFLSADLKRVASKRRINIVPFGKISYFVNDLTFKTDNGTLFDLSERYELGIKINSSPVLRIGSIKIPDLHISYIFSEDLKGIKIRF